MHRASRPVSFTPLHLPLLPYKEQHDDGTNAFIYSRFLVPYLCDYNGPALFLDGADMLCRADIAELWDLFDPFYAVQVVKHHYKTTAARKYVGTGMEADNRDYPRKNWSSLMLFNCSHKAWQRIPPKDIGHLPGSFLHRFEWIPDRFVGELPKEWNWLVREYPHNPAARLVHYTLGVPGFPAYAQDDYADEWREELRLANHAC